MEHLKQSCDVIASEWLMTSHALDVQNFSVVVTSCMAKSEEKSEFLQRLYSSLILCMDIEWCKPTFKHSVIRRTTFFEHSGYGCILRLFNWECEFSCKITLTNVIYFKSPFPLLILLCLITIRQTDVLYQYQFRCYSIF